MMYEAWRITYQSAEQAARAAYRSAQEHQVARQQAEAELARLRTEVKAARNHIGDSITGPAGLTAVSMLEQALKGEA